MAAYDQLVTLAEEFYFCRAHRNTAPRIEGKRLCVWKKNSCFSSTLTLLPHSLPFWHHTSKNSATGQLSVLQLSSILRLSTCSKHQISQVQGSVPQDCLYFRCLSQVQVVTCTYDRQTANHVSHDAFLGFAKLLEWLTKLRGKLNLMFTCSL